jgi:hypothetical protein
MSSFATSARREDFATLLLRADEDVLWDWLMRRKWRLVGICFVTIVIGAGLYGAAIGSWREPLQGFYTGIKLPLVILLTTLGNGLLNGMLAPLLGLNATFRQSSLLVLMTFAIASLILGALSPVAWFVVLNTPSLTSATRLWSPEYGFLQLTLTAFIALAGITGNVKVLPLLCRWTKNVAGARRVLLAWLAGNLLLGSQVAWVLRPFIWDPAGPVTFIGRQYFHGSFYETVLEAVRRLLF